MCEPFLLQNKCLRHQCSMWAYYKCKSPSNPWNRPEKGEATGNLPQPSLAPTIACSALQQDGWDDFLRHWARSSKRATKLKPCEALWSPVAQSHTPVMNFTLEPNTFFLRRMQKVLGFRSLGLSLRIGLRRLSFFCWNSAKGYWDWVFGKLR